MKKFIFIAIIFMASSYAFAQNSLNPAKIIGVNLGGSPSSTFNKVYNQSNFLRAWNWGDNQFLLSFEVEMDTRTSLV